MGICWRVIVNFPTVAVLELGNGVLDWADVSPLVHDRLGGLTGLAVALYRPLLRLSERGV